MTAQYIELGKKILSEGEVVFNERTGKNCLVLIDADLTYNVGEGEFPLLTSRDSNWEGAIAELLGYLKGFDDAADFEKLGTKTWKANARATSWLSSKFRKIAYHLANPLIPKDGDDTIPDTFIGRCYGKQLRNWLIHNRFVQDKITAIDQLKKVYENLKNGIDDRGEILMMWNPGENHLGCLRPCLYAYQFSLVNGTLYLHATQRSCDVPLGLNFNMVQVYTFLAVMARITGNRPGKAFHKLVNAHVYEDQLELFKEHMSRSEHWITPRLILPENLHTLEDVDTWLSPSDFSVEDYYPQGPIKYPFSV